MNRAKIWAKTGETAPKLPLQANQMLEALTEPMTTDQWIDAVTRHPEFKTKQEPWRVVWFYKGRLAKLGLIAEV